MISEEKKQKFRLFWERASEELHFEIESPYYISVDGVKKEVFACVYGYGSSNGTIVELMQPPSFEVDKEVILWAKKNAFFYSFINIDSITDYSVDYFTDILEDWKLPSA